MVEIDSRTDAFLAKWGMGSDSIDMEALLGKFRQEMESGLKQGGTSSLKMIPTYTQVEGEVKKGEPVIVIDAGGTNLRTCLVTFDENGIARIEDFK